MEKLTVMEAVRLTGLSINHIRNELLRGRLRGEKDNSPLKTWHTTIDDLEARWPGCTMKKAA
jgi:hypothetical protein